jgi:type IV secretion system protein VirB10
MNAPSNREPTGRPDDPPSDAPDDGGNSIQPLPGEAGIPDVAAPPRQPMSKKGLLAAVLFALTVIGLIGFSIARFAASGKQPDADARPAGGRPTAATAEPRKLDLTPAPAARPTAAASAAAMTRIPALVPTPEESAEPIGVRRTGQAMPSSGPKSIPPEDAPVMLLSGRPGLTAGQSASRRTPPGADPVAEPDANPDATLDETRRNLEGYQRQLQGLLDTLTRSTAAATATGASPAASPIGASPIGVPPLGVAAPGTTSPIGGGLFGGQLQGSATPRTNAGLLGHRSLTLPKGTAFTCALKTKVISAISGFIGCQVLRNVFSDDGRVLLIERGSHMDGEYRAASVRPGTVRIPVLWTRIRTPLGITVDIDSPGTGPLGESGIDGYVDNRWPERIGAAMLVSLINDAVQLVIQNQANDVQGDTIILPSTTSSTSKLAEKVLESTINIPPLIYQNQGGIVGIYVARDVDFSSVYELKPVAR